MSELNDSDNLLAIPEIKDAPVAPGVAIASIALNMAMKYHDISTVKDGAMYQQYTKPVGLTDFAMVC